MGLAQVVDQLSSKCEALSLIPNTKQSEKASHRMEDKGCGVYV
jgi:hypothetical protein